MIATTKEGPSRVEGAHACILDVDPGMRAAVPRSELGAARRLLQTPIHRAEVGDTPRRSLGAGAPGMMLTEGVLIRDVRVASGSAPELLTAGDVIRPDDEEGSLDPVPSAASWEVLTPTSLAALSPSFWSLAARWPLLGSEVASRLIRRSRSLAAQRAIASVRGVAARVDLMLWHLASRAGRVTEGGTLVPIPLTHERIADLVGARRPSVTQAVGSLRRAERLERVDGGWLLLGGPPTSG